MQRQHMARRTRLNDSGAPWNGNSSLANVESVKQRLHMTRGHAGSLAIQSCHFLRFFFNFFLCDLAKACSTTVVWVAGVGAFAHDFPQSRPLRWLAFFEDQLLLHETTSMPSRIRTDPLPALRLRLDTKLTPLEALAVRGSPYPALFAATCVQLLPYSTAASGSVRLKCRPTRVCASRHATWTCAGTRP